MTSNEGVDNDSLCNTFDITNDEPTSPDRPDSEFDECLGVPECLSIISIEGTPVCIEKDTADSGAAADATLNSLPFSVLYDAPLKFKSYHRKIFIPSVNIQVKIIRYERSVTTHLLHPNLYTIHFTHGDFSWTVTKRYKHINHLHQQLLLFRASLNIPLPSKTHRERRNTFRNNAESKEKKKSALPRFPNKPEALVPFEQLENRMKLLEDYLAALLNISIYRNHPETIAFLEVSHLTFIRELSDNGKEGLIQKRTGSTQPGQAGCNCFGMKHSMCCVRCNYLCNQVVCGSWQKRWFFIKETCFGYVRPKDGILRCVILFDPGFEVASGMYSTGMQSGLQILSLSRQITIKCWTKRKSKEWMDYLKQTAANEARDFTQANEHHSFAPVRTNITASWFVDGAGYMAAVADALEHAKEDIFIADWWLSPEIYMKRPAIDGEHWRLDKILRRKAEQGVKVFVLLYKEVEMALGINSFYSKQRLVESSPNIKVLRHPDHAKQGVFLWAHHEKIVVIDQNIAFLGGIDLCYGRWDDSKHRLTDLGSVKLTSESSIKKKRTSSTHRSGFPDHSAAPNNNLPTICEPDIVISSVSADEGLPRYGNSNNLPQLEPGDLLLMPSPLPENIKCNTPELERKNVLGTIKSKGKDIINLIYSPHDAVSADSQKQPEPIHVPTKQELIDSLSGSAKLWLGKDYVNFIVKDFANLELPYVDLVDRTSTPRMPWHDIGVLVQGAGARDVARHFIQRWNATKLEKANNNNAYPYLLPKSYKSCFNGNAAEFVIDGLESFTVTCQILRSVSCWSCGFLEAEQLEQSIHEAYIDAINRAQHYIYIENQFFITLTANSQNGVRNQIGDALYRRITRAHRENSTFRVYVVMPLLPGFEGEVGGPTGTSLHAITHWNYSSISRGKDAILNRLINAGIEDPSEYISFYGLRTHSTINEEPITELIYVHSKLMIVDDRMVICGSANINDRSLLGKRDSEIAVLIQDEVFEDGTMNGSSFPCGKYAGSLRKYLFKEHLGVLKDKNDINFDVTDPTSKEFYKDVWQNTAALNTEMYEKVFHCIPSDKAHSFAAMKSYMEEPPLYETELGRAMKMLETIEGHLVQLPLNFLKDEVLTPSGGIEGMMPTVLWT